MGDEIVLMSANNVNYTNKKAAVSLGELVKERDDTAKSCLAALDKWTGRVAKDW